MHIHCLMLVLHRVLSCRAWPATGGRGFLSLSSSVKPHASASRRVGDRMMYHPPTSDSSDVREEPVDAPYFPIYYNDVYEVDLPPRHRYVSFVLTSNITNMVIAMKHNLTVDRPWCL